MRTEERRSRAERHEGGDEQQEWTDGGIREREEREKMLRPDKVEKRKGGVKRREHERGDEQDEHM